MKPDKCEFCEGVMEYRNSLVRFRYKNETIYIEHVPVWVCNHCGEQYLDAKIYKHLESIARQKEQIHRTISFPLATFNMAAV